MDNEKIGLFIAQERKAKQLTQVDFAEKLHVSAKTVAMIWFISFQIYRLTSNKKRYRKTSINFGRRSYGV